MARKPKTAQAQELAAGAGMIPFAKPGASASRDQMGAAAGGAQVEGAKRALQHNLGLGGACVVTMYEKD